jgi:hypothetical protein
MTQDNKDLTENRIPFGLLDPDVQKRMKAWEHGWAYYISGNVWEFVGANIWCDSYVYRAKPAPVEPERVTRWVSVYPNWVGGCSDSLEEADEYAEDGRIGLWRITYDEETGLNPVIEVEGEQDE